MVHCGGRLGRQASERASRYLSRRMRYTLLIRSKLDEAGYVRKKKEYEYVIGYNNTNERMNYRDPEIP